MSAQEPIEPVGLALRSAPGLPVFHRFRPCDTQCGHKRIQHCCAAPQRRDQVARPRLGRGEAILILHSRAGPIHARRQVVDRSTDAVFRRKRVASFRLCFPSAHSGRVQCWPEAASLRAQSRFDVWLRPCGLVVRGSSQAHASARLASRGAALIMHRRPHSRRRSAISSRRLRPG